VSLLLRCPNVEPMNHTTISAPSPACHRSSPNRKPLSGRTDGVTSSVLHRGGGRVRGHDFLSGPGSVYWCFVRVEVDFDALQHQSRVWWSFLGVGSCNCSDCVVLIMSGLPRRVCIA
jgi:hypothetical protein